MSRAHSDRTASSLHRSHFTCDSLLEELMAYGFNCFLTTHTGSLPRPDDLIRAMFAKEEGVPVDRAALAARIRAAVAEVAKKQVEAGVDLVNDGEMSKPSFAAEEVAREHAVLEPANRLAVALAVRVVHGGEQVGRPRQLELHDGECEAGMTL